MPLRVPPPAVAAALVLVAATAHAQVDRTTELSGFQQVPSVSTAGSGELRSRLTGLSLIFELDYQGLEGSVQEAHLHLGQSGVNGGIIAVLCSSLGDAPFGVQACPPAPATLFGIVTGSEIVPSEQGLATGEFAELIAAIEAGAVYVDVHTDAFPEGEIRGQLPAAAIDRRAATEPRRPSLPERRGVLVPGLAPQGAQTRPRASSR